MKTLENVSIEDDENGILVLKDGNKVIRNKLKVENDIKLNQIYLNYLSLYLLLYVQ